MLANGNVSTYEKSSVVDGVHSQWRSDFMSDYMRRYPGVKKRRDDDLIYLTRPQVLYNNF